MDDVIRQLQAQLQAITEKQEAAAKRNATAQGAATKARNTQAEQLTEALKRLDDLEVSSANHARAIAELQKVPTPKQWPDVAAGVVDALKANPLMLVIGTCICFALAVGGITLHYTPALVLPQAPTPTPSVEKKE